MWGEPLDEGHHVIGALGDPPKGAPGPIEEGQRAVYTHSMGRYRENSGFLAIFPKRRLFSKKGGFFRYKGPSGHLYRNLVENPED